MPNILFASNNVSHFPTVEAGSVPGTYDSTRVPYSLALSSYELVPSPVFPGSTGEETWFHFRNYVGDLDFNRTDTIFQAYDAAGKFLFQLNKRGTTYSHLITAHLYDGVTTNSVNSTIPLTPYKMNTIDIKYKVNGVSIELQVYVNGSLSLTNTFGANPSGYDVPIRFVIGAGFTKTFTSIQHYSEIIVADGDTRNARLNLLRPLAAGAFEQWLGALGVLADDDTTTGLTTIAADQRHTMTLTPYTGAANISNFVSVSSTTRGLNSPSQLKHTVRLSGVNYDGPVRAVPYELAYQITDFTINPATSLPWHSDDLSLIETGFISIL